MCLRITEDDHSRNFLICMMSREAPFKLAPAYILLTGHSLNGEHATTVNGNGTNPNYGRLYWLLAVQAGIQGNAARKIACIYGSALKKCLQRIFRVCKECKDEYCIWIWYPGDFELYSCHENKEFQPVEPATVAGVLEKGRFRNARCVPERI